MPNSTTQIETDWVSCSSVDSGPGSALVRKLDVSLHIPNFFRASQTSQIARAISHSTRGSLGHWISDSQRSARSATSSGTARRIVYIP